MSQRKWAPRDVRLDHRLRLEQSRKAVSQRPLVAGVVTAPPRVVTRRWTAVRKRCGARRWVRQAWRLKS